MVTVLLLNYKRVENLPIILDALKNQTVECKIFLWNNGEEEFNDPRLDLVINSSKNLKCWARWSMASYANTPYVMSHDDDLVLSSPDSLQSLIDTMEENYEAGRAIGFNGVKLGKDLSYYPTEQQKSIRKVGITVGAKHHKFPKKNTRVDILKGRLIFFKTADLKRVPMHIEPEEDIDDIFISSYLAKRSRKHHIVTSALNGKVEELKGGAESMALSQRENWEDYRTIAAKKYFKHS
jgi:hypothetical protein